MMMFCTMIKCVFLSFPIRPLSLRIGEKVKERERKRAKDKKNEERKNASPGFFFYNEMTLKEKI